MGTRVAPRARRTARCTLLEPACTNQVAHDAVACCRFALYSVWQRAQTSASTPSARRNMRLSAAAHGGGDEACLGQGRDTGRDNTWGTSAAHQERSCSPHVVRGASSGSSSCDAGAACRNPVVHPRKQPGYAGQPATVGSARGSKPASGTMVANRSAAVAAAACRRTLRGPYTGRPTLRPRRSPWRDEGPRVNWVLTRGSTTTITPSHRHTVF